MSRREDSKPEKICLVTGANAGIDEDYGAGRQNQVTEHLDPRILIRWRVVATRKINGSQPQSVHRTSHGLGW